MIAARWRCSTTAITVPITNTTAFYRVGQAKPDIRVGQLPDGEQAIPTKQILRAAGQQVQFGGRPVDLVLSPDGRFVFIKNINNLVVADTATWTLLQTASYPGGGASLHGIATRHTGVEKVYAMQAGREIRIIVEPGIVDDDAAMMLSREVAREIERELEYPGQIKVTVIRESRAVEYAK